MPTDEAANPDPHNPKDWRAAPSRVAGTTEADALDDAGPAPYTFEDLTDFLLARGVPQFALDAVQTIQLTTTPAPSTKERGAQVQVVAMVTYYPTPAHADLGERRGEQLYHSNYYLLHQPL